MAVELEALKVYIGETTDRNDGLLTDALNDAVILVDDYVDGAAVPESILDRCYIIVATDLWERRKAPNGLVQQQYATETGIGYSPMRVARDPLAGVYALLGRFVLPW